MHCNDRARECHAVSSALRCLCRLPGDTGDSDDAGRLRQEAVCTQEARKAKTGGGRTHERSCGSMDTACLVSEAFTALKQSAKPCSRRHRSLRPQRSRIACEPALERIVSSPTQSRCESDGTGTVPVVSHGTIEAGLSQASTAGCEMQPSLSFDHNEHAIQQRGEKVTENTAVLCALYQATQSHAASADDGGLQRDPLPSAETAARIRRPTEPHNCCQQEAHRMADRLTQLTVSGAKPGSGSSGRASMPRSTSS